MQRNPVTPEGMEALERSLRHHLEVLKPQIVRDIEEARAHGDISENSEYEDAKERQSLCAGRIQELEGQLATAEVIDITKVRTDGRVVFGSWVTIANTATGEERSWRIVGENQADVDKLLISFKSPIAKGLIGKRVGDEVEVVTPQGRVTWEILSVHYGVSQP
jgi:transcription elongation factor GreA